MIKLRFDANGKQLNWMDEQDIPFVLDRFEQDGWKIFPEFIDHQDEFIYNAPEGFNGEIQECALVDGVVTLVSDEEMQAKHTLRELEILRRERLVNNKLAHEAASFFSWTITEGVQAGETHIFDASQESGTMFAVRQTRRDKSKLTSDELAWDNSKYSVRFTDKEFSIFVAVISIYISGIGFYRQMEREAILTAQTIEALSAVAVPDYQTLLSDIPRVMSDYREADWKNWDWE